MTIRELRNKYENELSSLYSKEEIRHHFADLCFEHFGFRPTEVVLSLDNSVSASDQYLFYTALVELKQHKPIQYVIGTVAFLGLKLHVNEKVLIPRPETEELVSWILSEFPINKPLRVLDIGTGSGCIAIALKKERPNWNVSAWDMDTDSLTIAKENSRLNDVRIDFKEIDILLDSLPTQQWDIIISNPPYVPESWKGQTASHVLDYEPHHAIFVPDTTPLLFFDRITSYAKQSLSTYGVLYFEGHAPLMSSLKSLLHKEGFCDIVLQNDFRKNPRMIRAKQDEYRRKN